MPFPWSIIIGLVVLAAGIALLVIGVVVADAERLTDYGWAIAGTGLGFLGGKGMATVEARPTGV